MADVEVERATEEEKKRPRDEGEDGEDVATQKKLLVSSAEEEKKRPRDEGEDGEDVPTQENAQKKLLVSSAEAEPAGVEEEKKIPPLEAVETEKGEEILAEVEADADASAEGEKGESASVPVVDGNLKEASASPSEAKVGPKLFASSMDMIDFFYDLLHAWPLNFNLNKYEHLMLEDLLIQGHQEHHEKIGAGIEAFQVRVNLDFYTRCYHIIRKDGTVDDFSYRKCVDNILPLPEEFKARLGDLRVGSKNKAHGWGQHGRGERG